VETLDSSTVAMLCIGDEVDAMDGVAELCRPRANPNLDVLRSSSPPKLDAVRDEGPASTSAESPNGLNAPE
jgi:hypothetical protein